ncbi:MAG TPA: zf-HC2 domain-containing protein, partial [Vicinamibacteria bacterium]|nr:zf-HC2 domain-containing protein [Vicinamibacteria bacterium]
MSERAVTPVEQASRRWFPAWTLYARAFSGNRVDADDYVRRAVSGLARRSSEISTEAAVHARVLHSIRTSVLGSMRPRGAGLAPSVLELLSRDRDDEEIATAAGTALRRVRHLPREPRRLIERVLLRRPPQSVARVAASEGRDTGSIVAMLESGLRNVAAGVRPGSNVRVAKSPPDDSHPSFPELSAYVEGSLSGDEARSVAAHACACSPCGDRLGTMILLKAASTEKFRLPLVPRSYRRAAAGALLASLLAVLGLIAPRFMPNPWKEHAVRETVPRWFQQFYYRPGDALSGNEVARGLALLVDGRYREAVD